MSELHDFRRAVEDLQSAEIKDLLKFDPLHEVERVTGVSYKDDSVAMLGMAMAIAHNERKDLALMVSGDSAWSTTLDQYITTVQSIGFIKVYEREFTAPSPFDDTPDNQERQFVFFDPRGILLHFETYEGRQVGSGNFYYNWRPNNQEEWWSGGITSSGGISDQAQDEKIWVGSHDCREAIKFHVAQLQANGRFLNPWVERPFMALTNRCNEYRIEDSDCMNERIRTSNEVTARVIELLPVDVRRCVKVYDPSANGPWNKKREVT